MRKKKISTVSFEEIGGPGELRQELPDLDIMEEDRRRRLYQALEEINPEYRQVLYLIYFEEMTPEEIGKVMNKNRKQIYNLADRGRRALKEKLTGMDLE